MSQYERMLSNGAIDRIMDGQEVEEPIFQVLGNKKLASGNTGERYRLLISDGVKQNSFTMLATQLNHMITNNELPEWSIVKIIRYALSMVNNQGAQKRVMVICNIEVLVPGSEVGRILGPIGQQNGKVEEQAPQRTERPPSPVNRNRPQSNNFDQSNRNSANTSSNNLNDSIANGGVAVSPIASLSPYQNRWVIKARVTQKSDVRHWSNSRGEGSLFSMTLVDESGEIKCTAFRDQCTKFYDMIEVGKVFYFSKCALKTANKQFNNTKNDFEMTLTNETQIVPCHEDDVKIPDLTFNFEPIESIEKKAKDSFVDVLGIVKSCGDVQNLVARNTGRELKKRDVTLVDRSNTAITLTLWGSQAENFDGSNSPVVAIKEAKVGEFQGGKSISMLSQSVLQMNPDLPPAHSLRGWYNSVGHLEDVQSISRSTGGGGVAGTWLSFKEAADQRYGHPDRPNVYINKATITLVMNKNAIYKSCPTEGCKKKVLDQDNGMFRCEKCNQAFPNFIYRLLVTANLVDWTDNIWATAFSDQAELILGTTAQELGELQDRDESAYLEKIGEAAFNSYQFKLILRTDNYNDETRIKSTIAAVQPINFKTYNEQLFNKIKECTNIQI